MRGQPGVPAGAWLYVLCCARLYQLYLRFGNQKYVQQQGNVNNGIAAAIVASVCAVVPAQPPSPSPRSSLTHLAPNSNQTTQHTDNSGMTTVLIIAARSFHSVTTLFPVIHTVAKTAMT